jgi:hypothetical protein
MDVNLAFCESRALEQASGHHHTHQGPKESKHFKSMFRKRKKQKRKGQQGRIMARCRLICVCIFVLEVIACTTNQKEHYFFLWKTWFLGKLGAICSSTRVKTGTQNLRTPLLGNPKGSK